MTARRPHTPPGVDRSQDGEAKILVSGTIRECKRMGRWGVTETLKKERGRKKGGKNTRRMKGEGHMDE